ncbi:MAG: threonylcarbamoyl-AMP synthase [Gammaproteobacteria bacterium]|nr:threonylcarbamoyl-AMP synthase [Gammaproteobacteria bacterium]
MSHTPDLSISVNTAVQVLHRGGVIAYPTEYCFGLGCDPRNRDAVERLLAIKRRKAEQGVILIAADLAQVGHYAELQYLKNKDLVLSTWPGPNTWLLPIKESVPDFIKGQHSSIAMRIPQHEFCLALLNEYGHPIVSTSANRSGEPEHLTASSVANDIGDECDLVIDLPVGGLKRASIIRDAVTGATIR